MSGGECLAVADTAAVLKNAVPAADTDIKSSLVRSDWRESDSPGDNSPHSRPWGKGCYVHLRSVERDSGLVPVHAEQRQQ